eukprot:PITA_06172
MVAGYAHNGKVDEALKLFREMPGRNTVSLSAMISGYLQNGCTVEALKLFQQMQMEGTVPESKTLACVLSACAELGTLEQGRQTHEEVIRRGYRSNLSVANALVDMYSKCGNIESARNAFEQISKQDVVSWTSMIAGYSQNGLEEDALKLFQKMQQSGVRPNSETFARVLPACTDLWDLEQGYAQNGQGEEALRLFQEMQPSCVKPNSKTFATLLSACANLAALEHDMYAKCSRLTWACHLFERMQQRDVVSWTAIIAGHAQNGLAFEALKIFQEMQLAGVKPNAKTFAGVLPAYANLAALDQGKEIHQAIIKRGLHSNVFVPNGLIDMYAKCGSIGKAHDLFDSLTQRNVVSWTTMIAGYAMHSYGKEALKLFEEMKHSGMAPSHITLLCVLSACRHAGLVDEGRRYFNCMNECYNIKPSLEHYNCMVDLLGRAGYFEEAQDFISKMPIKPDVNVWRCLLSACRIHNNVELGERVAEYLFELEPKNAAHYTLLSNIYAAAGRWGDIERYEK